MVWSVNTQTEIDHLPLLAKLNGIFILKLAQEDEVDSRVICLHVWVGFGYMGTDTIHC